MEYFVTLDYFGGHPEINRPGPVRISRAGDAIVVRSMGLFGLRVKERIDIPKTDIVSIDVDEQNLQGNDKKLPSHAIIMVVKYNGYEYEVKFHPGNSLYENYQKLFELIA